MPSPTIGNRNPTDANQTKANQAIHIPGNSTKHALDQNIIIKYNRMLMLILPAAADGLLEKKNMSCVFGTGTESFYSNINFPRILFVCIFEYKFFRFHSYLFGFGVLFAPVKFHYWFFPFFLL